MAVKVVWFVDVVGFFLSLCFSPFFQRGTSLWYKTNAIFSWLFGGSIVAICQGSRELVLRKESGVKASVLHSFHLESNQQAGRSQSARAEERCACCAVPAGRGSAGRPCGVRELWPRGAGSRPPPGTLTGAVFSLRSWGEMRRRSS